jgi:hypothetical protein
MVYLADFRGRRVIWDASLPYVTIDHQTATDVEDERAEAHGPFWVPLGYRSMAGPVRVERFRGGFEILADFAAGPFRYTQLWRFHQDGRVAPWLTIYGPGVHDAHTYHPHWRFDLDLAGAGDDAVERWEGGRWERISQEGWFPYTSEAAPDGAVWRQVDFGSRASVTIRPNHWEDAELFAIRHRTGEWSPFSPCSSPGGQPFPAAYVGAEDLDGQDVILWYVGHVHHDAAFPFTSGPWFRLQGF